MKDKQLEEPEISVMDNELKFFSSTPNAKYYYTIECEDNTPLTSTEDGNVELNATYKVTAYAYAEDHDNSETVTAYLVWVNPTLKDADNVIAMEARKAVKVRL